TSCDAEAANETMSAPVGFGLEAPKDVLAVDVNNLDNEELKVIVKIRERATAGGHILNSKSVNITVGAKSTRTVAYDGFVGVKKDRVIEIEIVKQIGQPLLIRKEIKATSVKFYQPLNRYSYFAAWTIQRNTEASNK